MRVLLVGPDHEDNLSIRYLSASLRARGHVAELARFNSSEDHDAVVADAAHYDVVGLSMCFQSRALEFLALADGLKRAGCRMVVMGGHYATCEADELVTQHRSVDVIAIHEGEHTLVELVEAGPDRSRWANIPGIVYLDRGLVRRTGERRAIEDLDTLPAPDRRGDIHLFAGVPTAYLLGSRGCVARCDYCCIVTLHKMAPGKKYRRRDPANVVRDGGALPRRGIRQFIFHDDNFLVPSRTHNHARLDAYERALEQHGMTDIGFTIKCRPPDAERSVFERLKRMGLLRVFFGIESASEAGLASIGRVQTVEQSKAALDLCRELDVSSQYTMMMFHPDATPETVEADLSFLRDNIDHALNFCRTEIYSGTPLEQRMRAEGRARGNYLARTYDITDPSIGRACAAALDLFGERSWEMGGLMERIIGMDHLSGVVRRFYTTSVASRWRRDFAALRRRANTDLVTLLTEVTEAARRASSLDDGGFRAAFLGLRERERGTRRRKLLAECERAPRAPRRRRAPGHRRAARPGTSGSSRGCRGEVARATQARSRSRSAWPPPPPRAATKRDPRGARRPRPPRASLAPPPPARARSHLRAPLRAQLHRPPPPAARRPRRASRRRRRLRPPRVPRRRRAPHRRRSRP
ncbi:MAG: radical SAM protein [Polyangiaceae bacterium]